MPPLNDNIGAATAISGASGTIAGDNTGGTLETNEAGQLQENNGQANYGGGRTVWYAWTAPATDTITFSTAAGGGSPIGDTVLAVIDGSTFGGASLLGWDDDSGPGFYSVVSFAATIGVVYYIAVDGYNGNGVDDPAYLITDTAEGTFDLSWATAPPGPPANDDRASAIYLGGGSPGVTSGGCLAGTTLGGTAEGGEPDPAPGFPAVHSVWYRWQAPRTSTYRFWLESTDPNMADGIMSIYPYGSSTPSVQGDDQIGTQPQCDLSATVFTSYNIQVDTRNSGGTFTLRWVRVTASPPANDDFASAIVLSGASGSVSGTVTDATAECDEPNDDGPGYGPYNSVWYKFVAATSGRFRTTLTALALDNSVISFEWYSGATLAGLTSVNQDPLGVGNVDETRFLAAGTYYLRLQDGYYTPDGDGTFGFDWLWTACAGTPGNDDFASATTISGSGNINQDTVCSTKEVGEPFGLSSGVSIDGTTWYKVVFTAGGGRLHLDWNAGGAVNVYTGTTLAGLVYQGKVYSGAQIHDFDLPAGTHYVQFAGNWDVFDVDYVVTQASPPTTTTAGPVTHSSVGSYTRVDGFPLGTVLQGYFWLRFVLRRNSGTMVRNGATSYDQSVAGNPLVAGGTDDMTFMRLVNADGTTVVGTMALHGDKNGLNEVQSGFSVMQIDGVPVTPSATERFVGSAPRSQDVMLVEVYVDAGTNTIRYLDLGIIDGPPGLAGWSLSFSDIEITDDVTVGPLGSPDAASRDLGYFGGWTDGGTALATGYTVPTVTAAPPAGGPAYALVCPAYHDVYVAATSGQIKPSVAYPFLVSAFPASGYTILHWIGSGNHYLIITSTGLLRVFVFGAGTTTIAALTLNTWYDLEVTLDTVARKTIVTLNGAQTLIADVTLTAPQPAQAEIGNLGADGQMYIGPIAVSRTIKSVPLGKVTVEKLVVTTEGTHLLPADMNPAGQITGGFAGALVPEIIYGGTPVATTTWSGLEAETEPGRLVGAYNGSGSVHTDLPTAGNPTTSGTATLPAGTREGWWKMKTLFDFPVGQTVFFDFYVQGPVGSYCRMADVGVAYVSYDGQFAGIDCDGTRQRVSGWCVVNEDTSWNPGVDMASFSIHFFGSAGDASGGESWTVDTFRAYIHPQILPIYARSDASGGAPTLLIPGEGSSASRITDGSDATMVLLDRQGSQTHVAVMGDYRLAFPGFGAGSHHYYWETSQFQAHFYLEYNAADPVVAPDAVKLLARTGGYFYQTAASVGTVSGQSRFGVSDGGTHEKSIGSITRMAIGEGELMIPEPPDPSAHWTSAKLAATRLRMGYFDASYLTDDAYIGRHAPGNHPARDYHPAANGGAVAYAQLEAVKLTPLLVKRRQQIVRYK